MKKINLRGISEILSERELKSVVGGVGLQTLTDMSGEPPEFALDGGSAGAGSGPCGNVTDCTGKKVGDKCCIVYGGRAINGTCRDPADGIMQYKIWCGGADLRK